MSLAMINPDLRISGTQRVQSPHVRVARADVQTAAGPGDDVQLSGVRATAEAPARSSLLRGLFVAGMMLPAIFGVALTATPGLAQTVQTQAAPQIAGNIVEEGNTFHLPAGTDKLVFGQKYVSTYDAGGHLNGRERYNDRVLTTQVHDHADLAHHALLTQTPDGRIEVHVPQGTVRVQIDPEEMTPQHQSKFNGSIFALDGQANTLASEENSDIRIVPHGSDFVAGATIGAMVSESRGATRIDVPPGTHKLQFNNCETRGDGSIVAIDGIGHAIHMQANWDGHAEVGKTGPVVQDEKGTATLHLLPGTHHVEIAGGTVRLLDSQGKLLGQQADAGFALAPGPLE